VRGAGGHLRKTLQTRRSLEFRMVALRGNPPCRTTKPKQNAWKTHKRLAAKTPESDGLSKDLQKRGFRFVGSTICYALMQATGMVNDHLVSCFRYHELSA